MGQEIVHCSTCGIRLRGTDFDRGQAVRIDHAAYCKKCSANLILPEPLTSSSTTTRKAKNSTSRIPIVTPRRAMEPVTGSPPFPPALRWGGVAIVVALIAAIALVSGGRSERPIPPPAPTPAPVSRPAPQLRTEPPPVAAEKTSRIEAPKADARAELAEIDRKVAAAAAEEKFRQGFDLLAAAKDRVDTLEWVAEIQRRTRDLDGRVKTIYAELSEKLDQARTRGAAAEAAAILDRIAKWDLPGYGAPAEKPAAPAPTTEAPPAIAPPLAPVAAPAPAPVTSPPPAPPAAGAALKWTALAPKRMTATEGVVLTAQDDGSILASGPLPLKCRYSIVVQTDLKGIWGFRLEALTDKSLPASGPGRAGNGNFMLSEFQVQVLSDPAANAGTSVALDRLAAASFTQDGFSASQCLDGVKDTGWAISPQFGRPNEAVFDLKNALTAAGPLTLLIVLDHQSIFDQHQIGRFRISATTSKGTAYEMATRVPVIDPSRVPQAIQRGIAWLRTANYPADYEWSANELVLWTYVHAGVPESDPEFQKRLKQMLDGPLDRTYRVALQAMILEELDRVAYQLRIWQCAQFLIDNQCLNGQWLYGAPTEMPKGVPTPARPPVPTAAKLDAEGRRIRPKIVRKLIARKTRDGPAEGDNSNSQYAALGLRACFDAGIAIPEETIHRAMKWWTENQSADERKEGDYAARGWGYGPSAKDPRPYHAMTVGGISSMTIYEYMLGRDWKKTASIRAGINWIAQSWTVTGNYYYLYGLERAGVLYGGEKFGRYAWYPMGAQFILDQQDPSGAWVTPPWWGNVDPNVFNTWNTCLAILFLRHATRPLVASEDRK